MTANLSTPTPSTPLATALKETTLAAHESAEHSHFMENLMSGSLSARHAIALMEQLYYVYSALEEAVDTVAADQRIAGLHDPKLNRVAALEADLAGLIGDNWRSTIAPPTPATQAYTDRLTGLADKHAGHQIAAHHYVRYLGDISGGQVVARKLTEHYDIAAQSLSFYDFDLGMPLPHYRTHYREQLNALPVSSSERGELLDEAVAAFSYNTAVFASLEDDPKSSGK